MRSFATTLSQPQRQLGLPRRGNRHSGECPATACSTSAHSDGPGKLAQVLNGWLKPDRHSAPERWRWMERLIQDHIALLTLAQHEMGLRFAVAVYDQKVQEGAMSAASALLEQLPALDDKIITGDPLHNQRSTHR